MALLQRLFQNRRNARQYNGSYYGQGESSNTNQHRPRLNKEKIRLLIIADTEKGRVPYFDSNAIQRIEDKQLQQQKNLFKSMCKKAKDVTEDSGSTCKNGSKYQFQKMGSDVKLLEEMMFGAVAMAYKGSTLKVHHIRAPPQLVVTKVFYLQKPKPESANDPRVSIFPTRNNIADRKRASFTAQQAAALALDSSFGISSNSSDGEIDSEDDEDFNPAGEADSDSAPSSLSSSYADQLGEFPSMRTKVKTSHVMSIPVDVPLVRESFADSTDEDSGLYSFTSSGSFQSLFPSPSNNSANSYNSLHRRWMRSQTTSLQRQWDSQETLNSMETSQIPKKKKIKLAIGIMFSMSDGQNMEKDLEEFRMFQNFFFAHMALIEGHVEGLRGAVERAVFGGRNTVPSIFEALDQFRDTMYDLYMSPRLREPVWLSMMSNISYRYALCESFVHEFMVLASKYDNKSTKFFVSTLLSAVLTYHLAWVATVTPVDGTASKTYKDKHSAKWIDTLAKTHPYNPLWAQLGDLYGAIGNPLRVARTIVVGRKADLVNKFLYVLSYFIRCSDVHEAPFSNCLSTILDSRYWDQCITASSLSRSVLSEDGSVTPVESVLAQNGFGNAGVNVAVSSTPTKENPSSQSPVTEGEVVVCDNCGSCSNNAIPFCSASFSNSSRLKKVESPSPSKTVKLELSSLKMGGRQEESCCSYQGEGRVALDSHQTTERQRMRHNNRNSDSTLCAICERAYNQSKQMSPVSSKTDTCHQCDEVRKRTDDSCIKNSGNYNNSVDHQQRDQDETDQACRMLAVNIVEESRLENVKHVRRAADNRSLLDEEVEECSVPQHNAAGQNNSYVIDSSKQQPDWNIKRPVSMLARQLAADKETDAMEKQKAKVREAQKLFLSGGSNSMFEEYFEGDAEIKTIDDVSEHQRVVRHPVPCSSPSTVTLCNGKGGEEVAGATGQPKISVSHQNSTDTKPHLSRSTSLNTARCRSVTPTELDRRRHISSTSSLDVDLDMFDPLVHCQEIPMPAVTAQQDQPSIQAYDKNFGRSLLGGYSDHYMSDFVLHGTSDTSFRPKLLHDLQTTVQHSILDDPVCESVCVIADTDNWTVEVANSRLLEMSPSGTMPWTTSHLVASLIESMLDLHRLKMSAEFCIMHLEDRMQEMYFKSLMLAEYIKGVKSHSQQQLTAMLGFDASDLPLLLSIAGTHTPNLALGSEARVKSHGP